MERKRAKNTQLFRKTPKSGKIIQKMAKNSKNYSEKRLFGGI